MHFRRVNRLKEGSDEAKTTVHLAAHAVITRGFFFFTDRIFESFSADSATRTPVSKNTPLKMLIKTHRLI